MCMYREGGQADTCCAYGYSIVTVDNSCQPVHLFSDEQVDIVHFLHYYNFR